MDIQKLKQFADRIKPMTCIISVETFPDGSYGNIRIVTGNDAYINAAETYTKVDAADLFGTAFVLDSPYERYIPKDLNFEDFCYRSAILGEQLHTYVKLERLNFWIDMVLLPLESDRENIGYCTYTQSFTSQADTSLMSKTLSPETSASVLQTCIKLNNTTDFRTTMAEVAEDIRALCAAQRCCVLLTDQTQRTCSVLCDALDEPSKRKAMDNYVTMDFFDIVSTWEQTIAGSTCLIIQNNHDWEVLQERNPEWYASLIGAEVTSLVLFPLRSRGEQIGYIWVVNFDTAQTVQIKETLELTTYFLGAHIAGYQLLERLNVLSSTDMLTGVRNRNAMNNRVDSLLRGKEPRIREVNIIFADLNGLKRVNDQEGHFAGDLLLKNAALILQKCFTGCEIYRAGGDEFMIIAPDLPESDIHRMIDHLRADTSDPNGVCFAVGYARGKVQDILHSMRTADERMYADKERFYRLHSDFRNR